MKWIRGNPFFLEEYIDSLKRDLANEEHYKRMLYGKWEKPEIVEGWVNDSRNEKEANYVYLSRN